MSDRVPREIKAAFTASTSPLARTFPSFEVYQAEVDGVTVVHVCPHNMPESAAGPIIRIYLNDEPVFENPPFPNLHSGK